MAAKTSHIFGTSFTKSYHSGYWCRFLRQFPSAAVSFEAFFCVGCDKSKGLNKKQLAVSKDNKKPAA